MLSDTSILFAAGEDDEKGKSYSIAIRSHRNRWHCGEIAASPLGPLMTVSPLAPEALPHGTRISRSSPPRIVYNAD